MTEAVSDTQLVAERTERHPSWWAAGLLFENCNCQSVCPGHVHFDQNCTHDRCLGYWAIQFKDGEFDGVALGGVNAVIAYDSPKHMIEGGWTEALLIDSGASAAQREAIETILTGRAGGPQVFRRAEDGTAATYRGAQ